MSPRKIPAHVGSEKPLSMARVLQRRWLACAAASDAGATLLSGRRRVAGNKSASAATTGRVADARGGTGTGTTAQRAGQQRLHDAKEGAEPMQVRVQKQAANRRNKRGMICRHVRPPQIQTVYCMLPFRYFPGKTKAAPARIPGWGPLFSFHFRLSEKCLYIHSLAGCVRHFDRSCVASCAAPYSSGGSAPFFVALFIPLCPLLRFTHGRVRQCAVPVVDQGRGQLYHTRAF